MIKFLSGYKTYIVGVGAIITAIGAFAMGTINLTEMIAAIFAAIQTMNIRHAITTTATDTTGKPA